MPVQATREYTCRQIADKHRQTHSAGYFESWISQGGTLSQVLTVRYTVSCSGAIQGLTLTLTTSRPTNHACLQRGYPLIWILLPVELIDLSRLEENHWAAAAAVLAPAAPPPVLADASAAAVLAPVAHPPVLADATAAALLAHAAHPPVLADAAAAAVLATAAPPPVLADAAAAAVLAHAALPPVLALLVHHFHVWCTCVVNL